MNTLVNTSVDIKHIFTLNRVESLINNCHQFIVQTNLLQDKTRKIVSLSN